MTERTITLREMDADGCADFINQLSAQPGVDRYTVDLSKIEFFSPFGMLVCSRALKSFRDEQSDCEFLLVDWERHTYPAHMGFFQAFGAEFGNPPGEAPGNARYLPINLLDLNLMRADARRNMTVVQNVIEDEAFRLAAVLVQDASDDLRELLGFAMTEMFRNVLEHSEAAQIGYCAQYWPTKDQVEVGILDSGRGVRAALGANPHLNIESDQHALHLALLPGVSGTMYEGVRQDPYDGWANSGFGLYMTSGICRSAGDFLICSGNGGVKLQGEEKRDVALGLPGTALRLRLHPSELEGADETLRALVRQGEEMAEGLDGAVTTASAASKLLHRWDH